MNLIHHSEIQIPEYRQRREYDPDAEQELISSFQTKKGILHAPVLREDASGGLWLVAGERRLRAIREIYSLGGLLRYNDEDVPDGMVPYTNLGSLSPLEAAEAEYEENVRRVDLTWQERALAEKRLLELRTEIAAGKGESEPHVSEIAQESRGSTTPATLHAVTKSILLANNLHRPEVKAAKSPSEAFKVLLRSEENERNVERAAILGKDFLGGKHSVHQADCIQWLRDQPPGLYDVILSDPPYGMGADEFGDSGGGAQGAHFYDDSEENWLALMAAALPEIARVAKDDAHCYLFCDFDKFPLLRSYMQNQGWRVFRTPLIWVVPTKFRAPWPEQGPQRKYECILFAVRGELKCTSLKGDVLTYPMDENIGHQAQKPVALYQDLLSRSARAGMQVLDPFAGSGPIFPAAHALSVIATGVEQDPAAYSLAVGRIQALKGQGK